MQIAGRMTRKGWSGSRLTPEIPAERKAARDATNDQADVHAEISSHNRGMEKLKAASR
jgi:hypothetical protein